jgi:hypothetical protein
MTNNEQANREAFEKWRLSDNPTVIFRRDSYYPERYENHITELMWSGWQAALSSQWRDIESAPKDGTPFLGYGGQVVGHDGVRNVAGKGCYELRYSEVTLENGETYKGFVTTEYTHADGGGFTYKYPTHWQPLPAPPSNKQD